MRKASARQRLKDYGGDGTIEITPVSLDLDAGLVNVPASARLAASASPQTFSQRRRELGFPVANRLVAENDAADQEHLRKIAQGKLIAQTPEHHEGDDMVPSALAPRNPFQGIWCSRLDDVVKGDPAVIPLISGWQRHRHTLLGKRCCGSRKVGRNWHRLYAP
jgi:hypothetical protein